MRTIAAGIGLLAHSPTAGAAASDWNARGASLIDAVHQWYSAATARIELAKLPSRLLSDILGEEARHGADSHVRDSFGRPIY